MDAVYRCVLRCVVPLVGLSLLAAVGLLSGGCPLVVGVGYQKHNLVSDGFLPADRTDANLVNPWGIVVSPTGYAAVSNNHTGLATFYDGQGNPQAPVITVPAAAGSTEGGNPTGVVYNGSSNFVINSGTK